MDKNKMKAYDILEERRIDDLDSYSYLLRHKKTGAKVAILENDDENKVFYIGFRTPPKDSTGVAHIVEHTVLCGSELFPLKDPFVELAKGSLNTFLNAMTYPDKTVYPVASCNNSDFNNLMHVYLDAVFHPNIYNEKKIFLQEGWHYELEDKDAPVIINGVVYNEMKGAFSSPDDVLDREVLNSLFPDTTYGVESGGDPEFIPELTYEDYLDFHSKYYHPSNSYIYLYGNCDMAERLAFIDEHYLSKYDEIKVDSFPGKQKPFDKAREISKAYPISEEESLENNTYLTYNAVIGTSLDQELYIAFQAIDYALVEAQGTPLKQALMDAGVGTEIYSTYENGIYQPFYSVVAKNANKDQKEKFLEIINSTLEKVVQDGFDQNALLAALNTMEFRYRESDFGTNPRGLILGLQAFDSWLYDEAKPFMHIESNKVFATLKKRIGTGYYEQLVQEYLIDNHHKSIVVVEPQKGLNAENEKKLADKLAEYKQSLSDAEIEQMIMDTKALKEYQEAPEDEEALKTIPRLKREDLDTKIRPLYNEERMMKDVPVLYHNIFTNGIAYIRLMFKMQEIPAEYLPYVSIAKMVLGYMDTVNYDFEQLGYEINIRTGGLVVSSASYIKNDKPDSFDSFMVVKAKSFCDNISDVVRLAKEIILGTKFDDTKRLKDILSENLSRMQAKLQSSGHSVAAMRSLSYGSIYGETQERMNGLDFYYYLNELVDDFDNRKDEIVCKIQEVISYVFQKKNLIIDLNGGAEEYKKLEAEVFDFIDALPESEISLNGKGVTFSKKNEGLMLSSQVQYVARSGNFKKYGLSYNGALRVLKTIMGYEYLWIQVRVKGGAYGCMSNYNRTGECYFVSYRDPNLAETNEIFENAANFVKEFTADEETMTKYIIGTLSEADIPLNPAMNGERSMAAYFTGITEDILQKERNQILSADENVIRELASYIEAFMKDDYFCVVGGEDKIKENKHLFMNVKNLLTGK